MSWGTAIENLLWSLAALVAVVFGNGEHDLISIVLYDKTAYRWLVNAGLACLAVNIATFMYLFIWLGWLRGMPYPENRYPWMVAVGGTTLFLSALAFIVGLWPVFSFLSPLVVVVTFWGGMLSLSFLPSRGPLAVKDADVAAARRKEKASGKGL